MKSISFQTKYLKDAHLFYEQYCHHDNTVLLESAEIVDKSGVQSLIGLSAALKVTCDDLKVTVKALNRNGQGLCSMLAEKLNQKVCSDGFSIAYRRPDKNLDEATRLKADGPMSVLRALQEIIRPCEGIFVGGIIAFDYINNFEYIGDVPKGKNPCSDYGFYVFDISVRSNHVEGITTVSAFIFNQEAYKETAFEALETRDRIDSFDTEDTLKIKTGIKPLITPDLDDEKFGQIVSAIKQHIIDGDAFQVVPSRTFSYRCDNPLLAYSYLKKLNPSPYMYYIKDPDFTIFGASPEFAVRFEASSRTVSISPIAGTRARGIGEDGNIDTELDSRIELELRTDKKEVAEHLMLVDLARNDLARISKKGSRYVDNMLHIDKYQSVMHLVSDVHATLDDSLDALHAYLACMNMGTLSGAPKIMAHEIIYRYEGKKRGSYGGVVAILGNDGSFDSCIAIRSAFVKDNTAYVQAGCGVVFDSDIKAECQETVNKARSVLNALAMALED
ncbi:MAG: anthranilate synthase component 1 [Succinivibrio sp.]